MRSGFTLIELLIGIAIIGLITSMIAPFLRARLPGMERKQFVLKLNGLIQLAQQQAIITRKMHRIIFNIKERFARVEKDITPSPKIKTKQYAPLKTMISSVMRWPDSLDIKQFIVGGYDEMQRFSGDRTRETWMLVGIDGMTQQVTINMYDKNTGEIGKPAQVGLVLNPFTAQFKVYDVFQQ